MNFRSDYYIHIAFEYPLDCKDLYHLKTGIFAATKRQMYERVKMMKDDIETLLQGRIKYLEVQDMKTKQDILSANDLFQLPASARITNWR